MDELIDLAEDALSAGKEDALSAFERQYAQVRQRLRAGGVGAIPGAPGGPDTQTGHRDERETIDSILRIAGKA